MKIVRDTEPASPASVRVAAQPRPGIGYARHRYLVGGLVSVISDVELPELEHFQVPQLDQEIDIEIRRGHVGHRAPRRRTLITQFTTPAAFRYEEHLGALGANFSLDLEGERIKVVAGPCWPGRRMPCTRT